MRLSGIGAGELAVDQFLRRGIEDVRDLRQLLAGFDHHRQHLQRGDEAVAGGREIRQHDMAGLFAAQVEALFHHPADDIAVADLRALQLHADGFEMGFKPEIGHDGGDDGVLHQPPLFLPALRDEAQQLVAVDDAAGFVAHHDAVGVAIERDADVGAVAVHRIDHGARIGGADFAVDVEAVGLNADWKDFGAEFEQCLGGDLVGGAVGAIDDDAQAGQPELARERRLDDLDIARLGIVDPVGAAKVRRGGETLIERTGHQRLDCDFRFVRELVAVRSEQLDAVVGIMVVAGGDHHAKIGAQAAGEHGDAGRRQRAEQHHVHALGGEARGQRRFQHVAGEAGVLADDDEVAARPVAAEIAGGGHAQPHRHFRRDAAGVGDAADAIGAEDFPRSHSVSSFA